MKADNECFTQARWRRHAISRECRCQYGRIVEVVALGQGQTIVGKRQRLIFAEEFARGLGKDVFPVQITSRQDDIAPSVREVGPYSGADVEIRTVASSVMPCCASSSIPLKFFRSWKLITPAKASDP